MKHDYDPCAGEHIDKTCQRLVALCGEKQRAVAAEFNGIVLRADLGMSAGDVQAQYDTEMLRLIAESEAKQRAFDATPEGRERLRKAEERRLYVAAEVAKGMLPFSIRDQEGWDKFVAANKDDGYGGCALRYAARWANHMERDLARGASLASVVEDTSREADIEGITGFMQGWARSILQQVWEHGEELKGLPR